MGKRNSWKFIFFCMVVFAGAISIAAIGKSVMQARPEKNIDARRNDRVHLLTVLLKMTELPEYQTKHIYGREVTYCNIAARDVLDNREQEKWRGWFGTFFDDYGYDVESVFPTPISILGMTIGQAYRRAMTAVRSGIIWEVSPAEAQRLANDGIAIWMVTQRQNHEAIVCPDDVPFNTERGPLIAQVGRYCGVFYARDTRVFGNAWRDGEIKYYRFPE